ncbi:hypothetical protein HDE_00256 [Halotydeus destructor]|nr:hypothetical protein HDE_00256 [Halotydeus destructor]
MAAGIILFWIIALTKSTNCRPAVAKCPGEVGPDAVLILANETKVYKGGDLHYLIKQELDRLPIIRITRNVLDEVPLPINHTIEAVIKSKKLEYYCDDHNLNTSVVCSNGAKFSCMSSTPHIRTINVTNLSTASTFGGKVFMAFRDDADNEYQASHRESRIVAKMADGRKRNPTGLNVLNKIGDKYECLVFFDAVYGFHFEDLDNFRTPVVIRKTIDYQSSNTWLNCEPELCFDGRMDFAYYEEGSINVGRGHSRWRINLSNMTSPLVLERDDWVADAVVKHLNSTLFVNGNSTNVSANRTTVTEPTKLFFQWTQSTIDAAYSMTVVDTFGDAFNNIFLISGSLVELYFGNDLYSLTYFGADSLERLFSISDNTIDAAVYDGNHSVYLFRKNHYYLYDIKTLITLPPKLIQNNLFACSESFYPSSQASRMLDITNFEQFKQYRMQFAPKLISTTTTLPSSSEVSTLSTFTNSGDKISRMILITVITFSLSSLVFMLLILAIVYMRKPAVKASSDDKAEVVDFNVNPDTESTVLKTVQPAAEST